MLGCTVVSTTELLEKTVKCFHVLPTSLLVFWAGAATPRLIIWY